MLATFFKTLADWYMGNINYVTVTLLMAVESSFIPLPSEIVVPPAAWKAAEGALQLPIVVLCGTLGSVIGALVNYTLAYFLGRKIVYALADTRLMHLFMVNAHSIQKAEAYFLKYGNSSTFLGRLVPGIRHLISIPAGLSKMDLRRFVLFTAAGSLIWNAILGGLGYYLYTQKDRLNEYYRHISIVLLVLGVMFIGYIAVKSVLERRRARRAKAAPAARREDAN